MENCPPVGRQRCWVLAEPWVRLPVVWMQPRGPVVRRQEAQGSSEAKAQKVLQARLVRARAA